MITLDKLKKMKPGIFLTGNVDENNAIETGVAIKWVAVRGGIHDWCIYYHDDVHDEAYIKDYGHKIHDTDLIKDLVHCDDEAFKMYRH